HPAMITHPDPQKILILGGGEGATLREVLKHPNVKKVVMVDIDEEFVNLCKNHLGKWHRDSFYDKRVQIIFADAEEYIRETRSRFDIIISDVSDPVEKGPAQSLYTKKFYSSIRRRLLSDGIFVTHATEVHYIPDKGISFRIFRTIAEVFPIAEFYYEYIPGFSSLWSFAVGSLKYSPENTASNKLVKILKERGLKNLQFYDEETHRRLFYLPKCLKEQLIITNST
ncbi:MAG: methyltransferase domain-containing protein, partial [Nitrospirota bacterium]